MATPNYGYEKRQRELEKKRKKAEKAQAKAARKLEDLSAGKISADKAKEIVAKAYTQRMVRVKNIKSDQDVTIQREK